MPNYAQERNFFMLPIFKSLPWCRLKQYLFFLMFCFLFVLTHKKKIKPYITHIHFLSLINTHTHTPENYLYLYDHNLITITNNILNHPKSKMDHLECWNWLKLVKPKQRSCQNYWESGGAQVPQAAAIHWKLMPSGSEMSLPHISCLAGGVVRYYL